MSDHMPGPGWWQASDGRWYPPDTHPGATTPPVTAPGTAPPYASPPTSVPAYPAPGMAPPYGGPPGYPPAGYPHPGYPGYGGVPFGMAPPTNGLATASLVVSLVGIIPFLFGIPSVVAIVLGFIGRSQIKSRMGREKGEGLALAGIIIGFVSIALWILIIVLIGVAASHLHCVTNNQGVQSCTSN